MLEQALALELVKTPAELEGPHWNLMKAQIETWVPEVSIMMSGP